MFWQNGRSEAFFDVVNLALGAFLFLSPWIFGFTSQFAIHTSWMAGAAISIMAILAIANFFESEEWINLAIGLWVAGCPFILGFHTEMTAMRLHLVVGLAVAAFTAVELWLVHRAPPNARV